MSPMIDDDDEQKRDDLIIIVEDSKQAIHPAPNDVKSIIKSFDRGSQPSSEQHPKSILKTSSKLSKSFDQPNPKQPILKRHSLTFDVCFPSTSKTTHSILKHSHSSNDEDTEDDKPVKPILKKNKSLEHFQDAGQLINIKPILKKKDESRCD